MSEPKTVELEEIDQFFIQTMLKDAMARAMDKKDAYAMHMVVDLWEKIS